MHTESWSYLCFHRHCHRKWSLFGHLSQLQEHNYVHVSSAFTHWQVLPCEQSSSMRYRYLRSRTYFGAASFVCCSLAATHCHQDFKQPILLQDCGSINPPGTWWCIVERYYLLAGRRMQICHSCSHSCSAVCLITLLHSWPKCFLLQSILGLRLELHSPVAIQALALQMRIRRNQPTWTELYPSPYSLPMMSLTFIHC